MHGVISGVDINQADLRARGQQIKGNLPEPVIYLGTVHVRWPAVSFHNFGRRLFRGDREIGLPPEELQGLGLAGEERGAHPFLPETLEYGGRQNKIRIFQEARRSRGFVEIAVGRNAMLSRPGGAADGDIVGIGEGRENRPPGLGQTFFGHALHHRKPARLEVVQPEPVIHADHSALGCAVHSCLANPSGDEVTHPGVFGGGKNLCGRALFEADAPREE